MKLAFRMFVCVMLGLLWCGVARQATALTQNFDSIANNTALSTVSGWQAPPDYTVRSTSLISTLPGGNPSYPAVGFSGAQGVETSFTQFAIPEQYGALYTVPTQDVVTNKGVFETKVRLSSWQNMSNTSIVTNPASNSFMILLGAGFTYDTTPTRVNWSAATAFAVYFLDNGSDRQLWYDRPGFDNNVNGTWGFGSSTSLSSNWNTRVAGSGWVRDTYYTVRLSNIVLSSSVSTGATALLTIFQSSNPANILANNVLIRAQGGSVAADTAPFTNINQIAFAGARLNGVDHFDDIYLTNFPVVPDPCPLPQNFESIADGTTLTSAGSGVPYWSAAPDYVVRQNSIIDTVTPYGSAGYCNSKGTEALFAAANALRGGLVTATNGTCSAVTSDGGYFSTQVRMTSWGETTTSGPITQNAAGNSFGLVVGQGLSTYPGSGTVSVNWTNTIGFGVFFYDNGGGTMRVYTDRPGFDDPTHAFPGFAMTGSGLTNWNAYSLGTCGCGSSGPGWVRDTWYTIIISNMVISTSSVNATNATARLWVFESDNPANFFFTNTLLRSQIGSAGMVNTKLTNVSQVAFMEGRVSAVDQIDNIVLSPTPQPLATCGGPVAPTASFTANPTSGGVPLNVNFTDTSSGSPTSWSWDFGDAGTSTAQNPSHAYTVPGIYTVTLIASNGGGSSTNTQVSLINALTPFAAWQGHYFGCTACSQALGGSDPDADGMSNSNEFQAGFNPNNSAAYLHIISITKPNPSDVTVSYLGASGDNTWSPGIASRTNVLEFTPGTVDGSYSTNNFTSTGQTNILSGGSGLGTVSSMTDPGGATNVPSRYYRVRVLLP